MTLALVFSLVLHAGVVAFAGNSINKPEEPEFRAEVDLKLLAPQAPAPEAAPPPKAQKKPEPKPEKKTVEKKQPDPEPEPKPKPKVRPKPEPKPKPKPKPKPEIKPEPEPEPKPQKKPDPEPEPEPEPEKKNESALPEAKEAPQSDSLFDRLSQKLKSSRADLSPPPDPDAILARYQRAVRRKVERKKHYPSDSQRAGETGVVKVRFVIESSGNIGSVRVVNSSGHSLLDRAAVEAVQRAAPFPPIPSELDRSSLTLVLPVSFHLKHGFR